MVIDPGCSGCCRSRNPLQQELPVPPFAHGYCSSTSCLFPSSYTSYFLPCNFYSATKARDSTGAGQYAAGTILSHQLTSSPFFLPDMLLKDTVASLMPSEEVQGEQMTAYPQTVASVVTVSYICFPRLVHVIDIFQKHHSQCISLLV